MTPDHPTDDVLATYVTAPDTLPGREEVEEHLRFCSACGEIVAAARQFEAHVDNAETWDAMAIARLSTSMPAALRELAGTMSADDAAADYLLEPLLTDYSTFVNERITQDDRYYTCGVVRRLVRASEALREEYPRFALALAETAVVIAAQLPVARYTNEELLAAQGAAWRERANMLRYTGDYLNALAAIDRAERAFRQTPLPTFDLARIDYVRATILWKMERFAEALPLARSSRAIFLEFGETERWIHAGLLEGGILFDTHQYEQARAVFDALLGPAEALDLGATLGLVYNAIAATLQELHEYPTAATFFHKALALYDHYHMTVERTRTAWSLALLALAQGHRAAGKERLRAAMNAFTGQGNISDAGLVALDLAEHLLADGEITEALAVCDQLSARFASAGMQERASAALRFLQEAIKRGRPVPLHVVRAYFARLAKEPTLLFVAPDDAR